MGRVYPQDGFGLFSWFDIQIDCHGLTVTAAEHAFDSLVCAGIDFLMWHIPRQMELMALCEVNILPLTSAITVWPDGSLMTT